jgi:hypothetical protein
MLVALTAGDVSAKSSSSLSSNAAAARRNRGPSVSGLNTKSLDLVALSKYARSGLRPLLLGPAPTQTEAQYWCEAFLICEPARVCETQRCRARRTFHPRPPYVAAQSGRQRDRNARSTGMMRSSWVVLRLRIAGGPLHCILER